MISVIICTYNRDKYIYECLQHLAANKSKTEWEIIIVNNNSTDNTSDECKRFEQDYKPLNYYYFIETQQGLSFARNRGIQESHGEWLVFLDDDAFVEPDYIDNLAKNLNTNTDIGAFGGKIVPFFEEKTPDWLNPWSMSFVSALDKGQQTCEFSSKEYPIGANMGISRRVIAECGVFNTSLGRNGSNILLGGEEKDIFNRIRQNGYKIIYFPDITVRHCIPAHRTTKEFIARLGYGIGISERMRTISLGKTKFCKRLFAELIKWGGTIVLWSFYCLSLRPAKGNILVLFRYNVTKGLLYQGVI